MRQPYYDTPDWVKGIGVVIVVLFFLWIFVLDPFVKWLQQNWFWILRLFAIIISIIIFVFFCYTFFELPKKKRKVFEEEQKAKGLIKFIDRFGKEKWGKPKEVEKWKKIDEESKKKESFLNRITESIEEFEPARKYKQEFPYQTELCGWLKHKFPSTKIEIQTGSSRPDIVIDDIAIEVKGPTDRKQLKTIADKILRYSNHYENIIVVLFEININSDYYEEWKEGIEEHFKNVTIIEK